MKLEGLKANFLGDSITAGSSAGSPEKIYWNVLKSEYGLAEARGYGIGGTRIAKQITPSSVAMYDQNFCERFDKMDDDADLIVVFGGTNDYGHGDAPIGTMDDRTPDTFYGALHYLYTGLINKYPTATIVVMTPLHRFDEYNLRGEGNKPFDGEPLVTYVNIIKEVAAYYSLPLLDLWASSGMQPNIPALRAAFNPDGLHPNTAGHAKLAHRLAAFLQSL